MIQNLCFYSNICSWENVQTLYGDSDVEALCNTMQIHSDRESRTHPSILPAISYLKRRSL